MVNNPTRKLIIFYSLEGNIKFAAEAMAEAVGADMLQLKPKKDLNPNNAFSKYFFGGMYAMKRSKPDLNQINVNPQDYDIIYMGTPVWAGHCVPALNSFCSKFKLTGKKIGLFCSCGGHKGKALEELKQYLEGNEILGEIEFRDPLKHDKTADKKRAANWAREIAVKIK